LEYSIKRFGVDVYPFGLFEMFEVLIEVFAQVELGELFIDIAHLL